MEKLELKEKFWRGLVRWLRFWSYAKYMQNKAKNYEEIDESRLDEIRNGLKNLSSTQLKNIFTQIAFNQEVPLRIRKEVIFEYCRRGGKVYF